MKRSLTYLMLAAATTIIGVAQAKEHKLFVGTYTDVIHMYSFNDETGALKKLHEIDGIQNPSYLAHNGKFLYAVSETHGEQTPGQVVALSYNADGMSVINRVNSNGDDPCYINIWGDKAVVSNYTGGNFSIYNINPNNGSLYDALQVVDHQGNSVNNKRQAAPHVHSARLAAKGKQIWVADLGTDRLSIYPVVKGQADVANVNHIKITPGSGPRHFDFHPTKPYVYLLNEMSGDIFVFKEFVQIQQVKNSMLKPQNNISGIASADIHVTPNGKFLYASHRGLEDCITVYSIEKDGTLKQTSQQSTMGFNPRNFVISPNGKYLLVANGSSDEIVVMSINQDNGVLTPLLQRTQVPKPVCLIF